MYLFLKGQTGAGAAVGGQRRPRQEGQTPMSQDAPALPPGLEEPEEQNHLTQGCPGQGTRTRGDRDTQGQGHTGTEPALVALPGDPRYTAPSVLPWTRSSCPHRTRMHLPRAPAAPASITAAPRRYQGGKRIILLRFHEIYWDSMEFIKIRRDSLRFADFYRDLPRFRIQGEIC